MNMFASDLVLSFYPSSLGFGYVLFEGALTPFDCGVQDIRGPAKHRRILAFLEKLIDRYSPVVLVLEDWTDGACQRVSRIVDLYESILELAKHKLLKVVRYSMRTIREHFAYRNAISKHDIALHIAKLIPAFAYQVPLERKAWTSESARQTLYDAAAVGLAFFGIQRSDQEPRE